jgi:hypothetical protein
VNLDDDVFDLGVRFQGVDDHFPAITALFVPAFAVDREGAVFVVYQRWMVGSAQVT